MISSLIPNNFEKMERLVLKKYIPALKRGRRICEEFNLKEIVGIKVALDFKIAFHRAVYPNTYSRQCLSIYPKFLLTIIEELPKVYIE